MAYDLVFDAAQKPPALWFPARGLLAVGLALALWRFRRVGVIRRLGGGEVGVALGLTIAVAWTTLATVTADASGAFSYDDTAATAPKKFYRVAYP